MHSGNWKYVDKETKAFDGGFPYFILKSNNDKPFVECLNCPHKRFLIQYDGFGCGNEDWANFVLKEVS